VNEGCSPFLYFTASSSPLLSFPSPFVTLFGTPLRFRHSVFLSQRPTFPFFSSGSFPQDLTRPPSSHPSVPLRGSVLHKGCRPILFYWPRINLPNFLGRTFPAHDSVFQNLGSLSFIAMNKSVLYAPPLSAPVPPQLIHADRLSLRHPFKPFSPLWPCFAFFASSFCSLRCPFST